MNRYVRRWLWASLLGCGMWLLSWHVADAADWNGRYFTLFDPVDVSVEAQGKNWFRSIQSMMTTTFQILAVIEICWAAAIWAFEKDNLSSLAVEVVKKLMFIGFFFVLLQNAPTWVPTIVDSLHVAGEKASGMPHNKVSTDWLIARGLGYCDLIMGSAPRIDIINVWGLIPKYLVAAFVCLGIVICSVLIAAEFFCTKIEAYILLATGAVFLGLGSSSWTKDYVQKYLNYALSAGVRMMILILILSINYGAMTFVFDYGPMLELLGINILWCILVKKTPEMTNALLSGGTGLTGSAMSQAGSAVVNSMGQGTPGAIVAGAAAGAMRKGGMLAGMGGLKAATSLARFGALGGAKAASKMASGVRNFGEAALAGKEAAEKDGKRGSAALLTGLGMATKQVAKNLPHSFANVVRGRDGGTAGPIARARDKLEEKAGAGKGARDAGAAGSTSGSASADKRSVSQASAAGHQGASTASNQRSSTTGQPAASTVRNRNEEDGRQASSSSHTAQAEGSSPHSGSRNANTRAAADNRDGPAGRALRKATTQMSGATMVHGLGNAANSGSSTPQSRGSSSDVEENDGDERGPDATNTGR